jgi:hypothetical protein
VTPGRTGAAAVVALVLAALAAGVAGAARADMSVEQYRSYLNSSCRSLTPRLKAAETGMAAAQKADDAESYFKYFGENLGYGRVEVPLIITTQVPAALRGRMAPAIRTAEQLDGVIGQVGTFFGSASKLSRTQFTSKLTALMTKIARLNAPFNHELDAAGLQDYGSKQS